jgi:hypothetical protein
MKSPWAIMNLRWSDATHSNVAAQERQASWSSSIEQGPPVNIQISNDGYVFFTG